MAQARTETVRAPEPPRPAPATLAMLVPRAMTKPPVRGTAFWVQVGAFRNVEQAMTIATALRDHAVSLITAPDQPLMRVVVGPFANRTAATAKLRELRSRGYEGFIAKDAK